MMEAEAGGDKQILDHLFTFSLDYFLQHTDPDTGLVADKNQAGSVSSLTVTGMGLSAYITAVENKMLSRSDVISRVLKLLRFIAESHQGLESDATGYKGFYYHFLDMPTGKRAWNSELSTVDTAFLIAGILSVSVYFSEDSSEETEIRTLADFIYHRVDWIWALNNSSTLTHGWKPESGFLKYRWNKHYSEALLLYILAMGSPSFSIDAKGYEQWTSTFELIEQYGIQYIYAGPLFIHQFSHLWLDFRNIFDRKNRDAGFDYFENSRRATYVHRNYAKDNPKKYNHYGEYYWGLSAGDGPGRKTLQVDGLKRTFYNYLSRGAPFGPDDGTISPWSVVAALPFAPEIVMDTIRFYKDESSRNHLKIRGYESGLNLSFISPGHPHGWSSPWQFGLNQGAVILMIENYRSGKIWELMKKSPYIIQGLRKAGFTGGYLSEGENII